MLGTVDPLALLDAFRAVPHHLAAPLAGATVHPMPDGDAELDGLLLEDEESFTRVLANAQQIRDVPGSKNDRNDAAWDRRAHGLMERSFVPGVPVPRWESPHGEASPRSTAPSTAPPTPAPIQELLDLTRTRKQLVGEIARHALTAPEMLRT